MMDNTNISSELTKEIYRIRRRHSLRIQLTLGLIMVSLLLLIQIIFVKPMKINNIKVKDFSKIERVNDIQQKYWDVKLNQNEGMSEKVLRLRDLEDI